MPNWCMNSLRLRHEDPAMLQKVRDAVPTENLFAAFFPTPPALLEEVEIGDDFAGRSQQREAENLEKYGHTGWYSWNLENWGTKWDTNGLSISEDEPEEITLSFDTAWGPPITFYENMEKIGFEVLAYYYEPGMGICGSFEDGDNEHFEIEERTADWVNENIPFDVVETFDIATDMGDGEDDEFDDSEEDDEDETK